MENVRSNFWELRRFQKLTNSRNYEIEAVGHSTTPLIRPVLTVAGESISLTPTKSPTPLSGLKADSLEHWSFRAEVDLSHLTSNVVEMNIVSDGHAFLPSVFYTRIADIPNVPDKENITRVGGLTATQHSHLSNGRKDFYRFDDLLREHVLGEPGIITLLDWGVGCGRIVRHFLSKSGFQVSGLDIDKFNIDWMNEHLPQVDARRCDLNPPTTFGDDTFDVVISFSVLSHLTPENWTSWLAELRRISKPGALLLLSFHGDHSAGVYFGAHPALYRQIKDDGFIDRGGRTEIGDELFDYYRDVFYSDAYARKLFSQHFEVIDVVPGVVSGFQSIAVLRRV